MCIHREIIEQEPFDWEIIFNPILPDEDVRVVAIMLLNYEAYVGFANESNNGTMDWEFVNDAIIPLPFIPITAREIEAVHIWIDRLNKMLMLL